jgi:hypothetical protein
VPGPPPSVLEAVLAVDASNPPAPGDMHRATFAGPSYAVFPVLPSLVTDVVDVPQYAVLDANVEVTGTLVSNGWATEQVTTVTSAYVPLPTDAVILANASGGAITITLPDATQNGFSPGQRYTIVNTGTANTVTVNTSSGQLINGGTSVALNASNAFQSVVFDGTTTDNWWTWAASASSVSTTPTGPAGGSLSGTYPNPGLAIPVGVTVSAGTTTAFEANVTGDTRQRFVVTGAGQIQWGSGSGTADAVMSRAAAGVVALNTSTSLDVGGNALGVAQPRTHGMVAWAFDPAQVSGNAGMTNGQVDLVGVQVNQSTNVQKIYWDISTAAGTNGGVANQNWVGLYNGAGTLLGSANVASVVTTAGATISTMTASAAVTPGLYWVGVLFNSGTATSVGLGRGQSVSGNINNIGLSAAQYRFATTSGTFTSLPSTITPSSNTALQPCVWAGLG